MTRHQPRLYRPTSRGHVSRVFGEAPSCVASSTSATPRVRPLHQLHVDLGELQHGGYLSTVIDEGTRFVLVALLQRKSDA
jgi:hypothetical protein